MTYREILSRVDHTLLKQGATWEQIKAVCDDGLRFGTASVCIPPSFVKQAAEYLKGRVPVCTVIGFPNGYNTTAVKVYETAEAVENGADEIDMVVNIPKNLTAGELDNGYKIRRAAIDLNIPLITNSRLASAFITAFCTTPIEDLEIKAWEEYK